MANRTDGEGFVPSPDDERPPGVFAPDEEEEEEVDIWDIIQTGDDEFE